MKNKNLVFEKEFKHYRPGEKCLAVNISGTEYTFITEPVGVIFGTECCTYLTGPAVDRLHEFEKLGREPRELKELSSIESKAIDGLRAEVDHLKKELEEKEANVESLKKELDKRIAKEQVDIHKLIDEVREKKDCSVHILIGENYTSVDIRPDEPGIQNWIVTTERHKGRVKNIFICPNCGYAEENHGLYCRFCGEQLGVPKPEQSKSEPNDSPKKMTCREKLQKEHPDNVNRCSNGGCVGCPSHYGYATDPDSCLKITCTQCWDREIEE